MNMLVAAGYKVGERGGFGMMGGGYSNPFVGLHAVLGLLTWAAILWAIVAFARWMWRKGDKVK